MQQNLHIKDVMYDHQIIKKRTLALGTSSSYILPSPNLPLPTLLKSGGVTVSINFAILGKLIGTFIPFLLAAVTLLVLFVSLSLPELTPPPDAAADIRAAFAAARRAAMGSTLEDVGPLIN